jgi:hypothetical protein
MTNPRTALRWYQFSLQSLFLFVFFVASLCSLGACTHWLFSVGVALTVAVGGALGRIVAATRSGFGQGVALAMFLLLLTVALCPPVDLREVSEPPSPSFWVAAGIAAIAGGVRGGLTVRGRSG